MNKIINVTASLMDQNGFEHYCDKIPALCIPWWLCVPGITPKMIPAVGYDDIGTALVCLYPKEASLAVRPVLSFDVTLKNGESIDKEFVFGGHRFIVVTDNLAKGLYVQRGDEIDVHGNLAVCADYISTSCYETGGNKEAVTVIGNWFAEALMEYYGEVFCGVSQFCHGHEYRWIYSMSTVQQKVGPDVLEIAQNGSECLDIGWPVSGSNSSGTWFQTLFGDEAVKAFLNAPGEGPDLEDPCLVDISEYLLTIGEPGDEKSKELMERLDLTGLIGETRADDAYGHCAHASRMITEMSQHKEMLPALKNYRQIDFDDPFYGSSRELCYSELCGMYEEFCEKRKSQEQLFLVQFMDEGIVSAKVMHGTELVELAGMNDVYDRTFTAFDITEYGNPVPLEYAGWQPDGIVEFRDRKGSVVVSGQVSDH